MADLVPGAPPSKLEAEMQRLQEQLDRTLVAAIEHPGYAAQEQKELFTYAVNAMRSLFAATQATDAPQRMNHIDSAKTLTNGVYNAHVRLFRLEEAVAHPPLQPRLL